MIWAGIDAGKTHHHCVVLDNEGRKLLSRRVANDEPELSTLLADVGAISDAAQWAVDLVDGAASLLIGILLQHEQTLFYITGRAVHHASSTYRGEGKTDARDAAIIADQARMRTDLHPLRPGDAVTVDLQLLTARRNDLVKDRTRLISRLRAQLTGIFPALERALDATNQGPLTLLTGYQTPRGIRQAGTQPLQAWLRERKVRGAAGLAHAAVMAAERQDTSLPGEDLAAQLISTLAQDILTLTSRITEIEKSIQARFREHEQAPVLNSLPGMGPLLGAEFLAATDGNMAYFGSPDRLAAFAGVAPAPKDSGRVSGNLRRPRHYHRGLQRVFYMSALTSIRCCPESYRFYGRKRAEGKRHTQATLALARRRVNVLWALLRDQRQYHTCAEPAAA